MSVAPAARSDEPASPLGVDDAVVRLNLVKQTVQVGRPIWADLTVCNPTTEPIVLRAQSGQDADQAEPIESGVLPLGHVFSGPGPKSLRINSGKDNQEKPWASMLGVPAESPPIKLAPGAIVGVRMNIAEYYPALLQAGTFYLTWSPYGGRLVSDRVELVIAQLKQAVIDTSFGEMVIAFEYEKAPNHVANFIELAGDRFYNNKIFHKVIPGAMALGGCPCGDGTGVRPDGKLLNAEFSDLPHRAGTVSMSRKANDPDSASCQFFICMTRLRELDGQYTVFGQLVGQESFDTLQRILQVETDARDRPREPVYIRTIRIENIPTGAPEQSRKLIQ